MIKTMTTAMTTTKATTTATIIVVLSLSGLVPLDILVSEKFMENELSINKSKTIFLKKKRKKRKKKSAKC